MGLAKRHAMLRGLNETLHALSVIRDYMVREGKTDIVRKVEAEMSECSRLIESSAFIVAGNPSDSECAGER